MFLSKSSNEPAYPNSRRRDAGVPPARFPPLVDRAGGGGRGPDTAGALPSFRVQEALFRAVIERLHEEALAAEIAAACAAENEGGSLADILVASVSAKLGQLAASLDGSPHVEELFSEHLLQARDLYQKYTTAYAEQLAETITRVCRKQDLTLNATTPRDFARHIEMAINGTKSAYPSLQPAGAFLRDLEIMLRTLVAGAVRPAAKPRTATPKPAKKAVPRSTARKSGDRR
jgi:hypothetical protein